MGHTRGYSRVMNTRPPLRIVVLALVALLAAGSCSLLEPIARDGGGAGESTPQERGPQAGDASEAAPQKPEQPPAREPDGDTPAADAPVDAPAEDAPPTPGYDVLARGTQGAIRVPLARAIADPALWADFWAALTANQADPPARPEVDFDEGTVVVLLLGERPTGGYAVEIERVRERRDGMEVVVDVTRPAPGDMVTQALTTPYFVALLPVADAPVEFTGDDVEAGFEGD